MFFDTHKYEFHRVAETDLHKTFSQQQPPPDPEKQGTTLTTFHSQKIPQVDQAEETRAILNSS